MEKKEKELQEKNGEKRARTNGKERARVPRKNGEKRRRIQSRIEKSNAKFIS